MVLIWTTLVNLQGFAMSLERKLNDQKFIIYLLKFSF